MTDIASTVNHSMTEIISTVNLSKIFDTGTHKVMALKELSMSIDKGDFVSIQGPSGSGKSTLLNIIGCLDTISSGKVVIDGIDIETLNEKELTKIRARKIGFIFQDFNLLPILSGIENVMLPMHLGDVPKDKREERAIELLRTVGLDERMDHKPSQMSGGEKQRVAMARAMANEPSIILADEPTGNLDSNIGEKIMELLKELNEKFGTTIVLVTHDENMAKYAKKNIHLKDGRIENITSNEAPTNAPANTDDDRNKDVPPASKAEIGNVETTPSQYVPQPGSIEELEQEVV